MVRRLLALGAVCLAGQAARAEIPMPQPDFGLGDMASAIPDPAGRPAAPAGDITIGGNGRFGLLLEDGDTSVSSRLRFDLDANRVTDGGLVVGGRMRVQSQSGEPGTGANAGKLYLRWPGP